MALFKDKASAKWWIRMWVLLGVVAAAVVAIALLWKHPEDATPAAMPAYTMVKVTTATSDEHSVTATIALPCKPEQKEAMEAQKATVAAAMSSYLTSASGGALADPRNRAELLNALRETANQSLPPELKVDNVLFTDFVVGS